MIFAENHVNGEYDYLPEKIGLLVKKALSMQETYEMKGGRVTEKFINKLDSKKLQVLRLDKTVWSRFLN